MKDTVIVNGVTLTREQVEQALNDLNIPVFLGGDLVTYVGDDRPRRYVVIAPDKYGYGPLPTILNREYGVSTLVRITNGCITWTHPATSLTKVGTLRDDC